MKSLYVCCLAVLIAAPLLAQHPADPDKKMAGPGTLPPAGRAASTPATRPSPA